MTSNNTFETPPIAEVVQALGDYIHMREEAFSSLKEDDHLDAWLNYNRNAIQDLETHFQEPEDKATLSWYKLAVLNDIPHRYKDDRIYEEITDAGKKLRDLGISNPQAFETSVSQISAVYKGLVLEMGEEQFEDEISGMAKAVSGFRAEVVGYHLLSDTMIQMTNFLRSKDFNRYISVNEANHPGKSLKAFVHQRRFSVRSAHSIEDMQRSTDLYIVVVNPRGDDDVLLGVDIKTKQSWEFFKLHDKGNTNIRGDTTIPRCELQIPGKFVNRRGVVDPGGQLLRNGEVVSGIEDLHPTLFKLLDNSAARFIESSQV